jgi:hypothetical protein
MEVQSGDHSLAIIAALYCRISFFTWLQASSSAKDLSMQQTVVEVAPAPEEHEEEEEEEVCSHYFLLSTFASCSQPCFFSILQMCLVIDSTCAE